MPDLNKVFLLSLTSLRIQDILPFCNSQAQRDTFFFFLINVMQYLSQIVTDLFILMNKMKSLSATIYCLQKLLSYFLWHLCNDRILVFLCFGFAGTWYRRAGFPCVQDRFALKLSISRQRPYCTSDLNKLRLVLYRIWKFTLICVQINVFVLCWNMYYC